MDISETHIPVLTIEKEDRKADGCCGTRLSKKGFCDAYVTVDVGARQHPMDDSHYIQWILLETNCGKYTRYLDPGDRPEAVFCLCRGEKVRKAYAFCNAHGLWACEQTF